MPEISKLELCSTISITSFYRDRKGAEGYASVTFPCGIIRLSPYRPKSEEPGD